MGAGLWPVFEPPIVDITPAMDGKILLAALEDLDDLAGELGAREVSSFGDNRDVPDDFEGGPEELDDAMGPWDEWFAIEDGVGSFSVLAGALEKPSFAERFDDPSGVGAELREMVRCLELARDRGVRFRLEVLA